MSSTTNQPRTRPSTITRSPATGGPGIDPTTTTQAGSAGDGPRQLSEQELALAATGTQTLTASATAEPTMSPPGTPGAVIGVDSVAAWLTGKKVVAMWANRSSRNAYAYLDSVGWRRLADTNDSAHAALTMLASAARQTGSAINARDEGDGRIREIYLW